jgi:hypothetical protein
VCSSQYKIINPNHIYVCRRRVVRRWAGFLVSLIRACRGLSYSLPMLKWISQHYLMLLRGKFLGLCKSRTYMGQVVFHAQVAWIPHLPFFSVVLASIISGFFIPLTLLSLFFLPFRLLGGLLVIRLHYVYLRYFGSGRSQSSSLTGHNVLYR